MDELDRTSAPSLADEQQQLTRTRIRSAAMEVVARIGFDATVDEIAQLSGVSPRTIFRHYQSHDRLIANTVKDMFEACGLPLLFEDRDYTDDLIEGVPRLVDDLDGAIKGMAVAFHTRSAEIFGAAFWDIHSPRHRASEVLSEVAALRREYRLRGSYLLNLVWETAGGVGEPPEPLALAFALDFSAFTTQSLMVHFDQTPAQIGALTADIFTKLLRRAVEAQRSGEAVPAGSDGVED
jgi:AcrR family transcriptional regulator